jgi:hypothetical protein
MVLALLAGLGCAGSSPMEGAKKQQAKSVRKPASERPPETALTQAKQGDGSVRVAQAPAGGEKAVAEVKEPPAKAVPPKIIYTGRITIIVGDFDKAEKEFHALVKEYGGYVARSEVNRVPNDPRHGSWTVRIPVAQSDEFRASLRDLGALHRSDLDSQDITDQYYDTQAEQTNLEAREKALRSLYDKTIAGTKLSDLLEVDRELARVRGEINTLKGRLQRWDKEVAYATYTITMDERRGYEDPTAVGFGTTLGDTFNRSINALVAFGKFVILVAVALAPWLVLLAVLLVPLWIAVRRRRTPVLTAELAPEQPPSEPS